MNAARTAGVRPMLGYVLAVAAVGIAALLTHLLWVFVADAPLSLLYLAIVLAAVFGNTRSGILAIVLALGAEYFLVRHREHGPFDLDLLPSLALFAVVGSMFVFLVHRVRESEARLSGLLASATDAIVVLDENQRIVLFNATAESLLMCSAEKALGGSIAQFVVDREHTLPEAELFHPDEVAPIAHEISGLRSDGSEVPLEVSISRATRGKHTLVTLILRDIRQRKAHEAEIERLTRLYAALSQINQAIVWLRTREELLRRVCQVLVEHGPLRMAWIGWHDAQTQRLMPVAEWGDANAYLRSIEVYADDRPEGRGPSGTAFRERRPYICNDMLNDAATLPWRPWIEQRGFRASAAFPIRQKGEVCAILTLYAQEIGFFRDKEVALLDEAAADLSFALDNLAREDERRHAEAAALREREFSDAIIESLPGIIYLYDEQGHFLRWNQNFLKAAGYSADEMSRLHPIDFFAGDDIALLKERIAHVFSAGQASVEAAFVAKDGSATRYFFTGRRLIFEGKRCLVGMGIDIAERVRAERLLVESERKYRELVELANSIILRWDPDGRITFLNEFGQRFFGYTAAELVGRQVIGTIVPRTDHSGRDLQELMERVRANPESFDENINENMRRNGERVLIAWTNRVVLDIDGNLREILSVGTDVTERKRAEDALRISEERYRSTLDNILEGCQLLGFDWQYLYLNDAAAVHNRRPNRELLGKTMLEAWPGIESTAVFALLQRSMSERVAAHDEIEFTFADGSKAWFEVSSLPAAEGALVLSIDISARKKAEIAAREMNETLEREVAARTDELRAALVRAESADHVKSAFLATMSHELRTPLNSIIGFTGILLQRLPGPINDEQAKQLRLVQTSAHHLLDLINDVLDISKIEAGRMDVRREKFDLREVIERIVALLRPAALNKSLALDVHVPADVPLLTSDRRRVEQIIINLLNNAIKFTERGGIVLSVESSAAPAAKTPERIYIRVTDTGIGIKPDDLATLFQPFRQLDSKLSRQYEGTGLGLAICRGFAELLGGAVSAQSVPGSGSTFTLELPLHPET